LTIGKGGATEAHDNNGYLRQIFHDFALLLMRLISIQIVPRSGAI